MFLYSIFFKPNSSDVRANDSRVINGLNENEFGHVMQWNANEQFDCFFNGNIAK